MKVTVLLANAAEAVDGRLFILGGGLTFLPLGLPMALAIKIDVPWDETNQPHQLRISMLDTDGNAFAFPNGGPSIEIQTQFEVGRPAGIPPGSAVPATLAFNFGPMPLTPAKRYVWHLTVDGREDEASDIPFNVLLTPR